MQVRNIFFPIASFYCVLFHKQTNKHPMGRVIQSIALKKQRLMNESLLAFLRQIFNSRCPFMDISLCSWQARSRCVCPVISSICCEAPRQCQKEKFNMSWQTAGRWYNSAVHECVTEARSWQSQRRYTAVHCQLTSEGEELSSYWFCHFH